jgi:nitrogen fixation/metabolism regulation signal transduction histidine kinase
MKTNLAGYLLHEVRVPLRLPLLPIYEAISNSFDAINETSGKGRVSVSIDRDYSDLDGQTGNPVNVTIEDNGPGLNDQNFRSFNELYTTHKQRNGGKGHDLLGRCGFDTTQ